MRLYQQVRGICTLFRDSFYSLSLNVKQQRVREIIPLPAACDKTEQLCGAAG